MAEGTAHSGESIWISFGICKPKEGCHIDDVVAQLVGAAAAFDGCDGSSSVSDLSMTIIKSIRGKWVAVFAERKGKQDANPWINLPEAASFTKGLSSAVRLVDYGWFELNCEESKQNSPAGKKRIGDVVGVRRIYSEGLNQDKLAYSCLAILKSYFTKWEGLHSYTFYNSLDGKCIIGLGLWESVDAVHIAMNNPNGFPWEPLWKSLGVKKLKYEVCQVVYVTEKLKE
eukprot:PITA_33988